MGEKTTIGWTDHTFGSHWGCSRVSPGCDHCYAESFSKRLGLKIWGQDAPRRFFKDEHWTQPLKWDRAAAKAGSKARVFLNSMADTFEDRRDLDAVRERLWPLIKDTPNLTWLLLTKRPENMLRLAPAWLWDLPNVWPGTTAENQTWLEHRAPDLLKVPTRGHRFVSCEPLLTDLHFPKEIPSAWLGPDAISWVIVGGESGNRARPLNLEWVRHILSQAREAGAHPFVKQLGSKPIDPTSWVWVEGVNYNPGQWQLRVPGYEMNAATIFNPNLFNPHMDPYRSATWHTWDRDGVGGENATDPDLAAAKREAVAAVARAGHYRMKLKHFKGEEPTEWPEDLRVQETPALT